MSSPVVLIEVTLPSSHGDRPRRGDPVRGVGAGRGGAVSAADHAGARPAPGGTSDGSSATSGGCTAGLRRRPLAGGEPVDARGLPKPPTDEAELLAWFDEGAEALVTTLAGIEPDAPAWNFAGATPTAAFWRRRQAVETAVHRWDAEHAVGTASPVDDQLAADGIDEFLTVLAPYRFASEDGIDLGGSLHLHCTDVDGEWTIHTDDGVYRVDRGHAKGDVAVRGPASQLLLVVFQRLGPDADGIEVFGAPEILDRWLALGTL